MKRLLLEAIGRAGWAITAVTMYSFVGLYEAYAILRWGPTGNPHPIDP